MNKLFVVKGFYSHPKVSELLDILADNGQGETEVMEYLARVGDSMVAKGDPLEFLYNECTSKGAQIACEALENESLPTLPSSEGWHVSWEIDLDQKEAETPKEAAEAAAVYAIDQFERLVGRDVGSSKPALTINGQLIDFENDQ